MIRESRRLILAALIGALVVTGAALIADDDAGRAHPDRDDTRVERVVDVQLPTL